MKEGRSSQEGRRTEEEEEGTVRCRRQLSKSNVRRNLEQRLETPK